MLTAAGAAGPVRPGRGECCSLTLCQARKALGFRLPSVRRFRRRGTVLFPAPSPCPERRVCGDFSAPRARIPGAGSGSPFKISSQAEQNPLPAGVSSLRVGEAAGGRRRDAVRCQPMVKAVSGEAALPWDSAGLLSPAPHDPRQGCKAPLLGRSAPLLGRSSSPVLCQPRGSPSPGPGVVQPLWGLPGASQPEVLAWPTATGPGSGCSCSFS